MRELDVTDGRYLVVIGASAGGVDALARLAGTLPENFPAPIVIAQHADPKGAGRFAEILQRQTRLKINSVSTSDDELRAAELYLAPPGRNLRILDGKITTGDRQAGHPVPSIDGLFNSAAASYGDRLIAVILTGMGTDGVAGVRAVKEHGGTVVVQELESAEYPALPAAIPQHYVDFSSSIAGLSSLLTMLVSVADGKVASDPEALEAFLTHVRGRSGIDFRQYKMPTIRRRLSRLMAAANCDTLGEYLRYLNTHPDAYQRLISAFLIKVTGFFRDPALFAHLKDSVLPEIIKQARATQSELRLWSAGCATGEEAYSLAILMAELLGDEVEHLPIRIFATDLDAHAIDFARRGIYLAAAFEDMPGELVTKYFTNIDSAYQVNKRIRNLTVFGEYDLGQRAPFPRIDMILCRNVLIYFTKELQQRTLQLFAFSLRLGGYLALGKAETTSPLPQYFTAAHPSMKVYRREGDRLLIPAPMLVDGLKAPDRPATRRNSIRHVPMRREHDETASPPRWTMVDRLGSFLFESDIGVVVADRHYDILTINQAARTLLGIAGQGIGDDLIHLSQIPAAEFKSALDGAFRGEQPTSPVEIETHEPGANEQRVLHVTCYPDRAASKEGRIEGVIVVVVDASKEVAKRRLLESQTEKTRGVIERLTQQHQELTDRQASLIQANVELNAINADLRNSNEHLMISAEEAEASAEEVETLNEEMQATSEELETLNEELHATVEELNTTNEELGARSSELERLARESQQQLDVAKTTLATLQTIVNHVPLLLCITDRKKKVILASNQYKQLADGNDALPAVGQTWRESPSKTMLLNYGGAQREFAPRPVPLPDNGGETMWLLERIHNK